MPHTWLAMMLASGTEHIVMPDLCFPTISINLAADPMPLVERCHLSADINAGIILSSMAPELLVVVWRGLWLSMWVRRHDLFYGGHSCRARP